MPPYFSPLMEAAIAAAEAAGSLVAQSSDRWATPDGKHAFPGGTIRALVARGEFYVTAQAFNRFFGGGYVDWHRVRPKSIDRETLRASDAKVESWRQRLDAAQARQIAIPQNLRKLLGDREFQKAFDDRDAVTAMLKEPYDIEVEIEAKLSAFEWRVDDMVTRGPELLDAACRWEAEAPLRAAREAEYESTRAAFARELETARSNGDESLIWEAVPPHPTNGSGRWQAHGIVGTVGWIRDDLTWVTEESSQQQAGSLAEAKAAIERAYADMLAEAADTQTSTDAQKLAAYKSILVGRVRNADPEYPQRAVAALVALTRGGWLESCPKLDPDLVGWIPPWLRLKLLRLGKMPRGWTAED